MRYQQKLKGIKRNQSEPDAEIVETSQEKNSSNENSFTEQFVLDYNEKLIKYKDVSKVIILQFDYLKGNFL